MEDNLNLAGTLVVEDNQVQVTTSKNKKSSARRVPKDNSNLLALAKTVQSSWRKNPDVVLKWTTNVEFAQKVTEFETLLNQKDTQRSKRSPISSQLAYLDKKIDKNLRYVKYMIGLKFVSSSISSYFTTFGMVKTANGFLFPTDRQSRLNSLNMLVNALTEYELDNLNYGLEFWTEIRDLYELSLNQTTTNVLDVSQLVGKKELLKVDISKTLTCLGKMIEANNPDTSNNELRNWGFLKELF